MKSVQPVIASNGVPFLQMRSVGSHSTSGREEEGNKEGIYKLHDRSFFSSRQKALTRHREMRFELQQISSDNLHRSPNRTLVLCPSSCDIKIVALNCIVMTSVIRKTNALHSTLRNS